MQPPGAATALNFKMNCVCVGAVIEATVGMGLTAPAVMVDAARHENCVPDTAVTTLTKGQPLPVVARGPVSRTKSPTAGTVLLVVKVSSVAPSEVHAEMVSTETEDATAGPVSRGTAN